MLISNISAVNDAQLFEIPRKNDSSITASGDHILLGFYDSQSFDNPRIKNRSVTAPSPLILLGDDSAQSFENPQKSITVSLHQVPRFFCI